MSHLTDEHELIEINKVLANRTANSRRIAEHVDLKIHKMENNMIREGTQVKWKWGSGYAEGEVKESHNSTIERTIGGNTVKREGSEDDPALVIEQDDGQTVLKLKSEVERADD